MTRFRFEPDKIAEDLCSQISFACVGEKQVLWYYDNKNYVWIPEGKTCLLKLLKTKYPEADLRDYNDVLFEIQAYTMMRESQFAPDPNYIQCNKQVLNLRTLKLDEEISPFELHLRQKLDTELDMNAPPPMKFINVLRKALPDPEQLYLMLQCFSCVLLVRTEDVDKIALLIGSGQNGKSTILKTLMRLFKPYCSAVSLHDLLYDRFAMARLEDKLANIFSDIGGWKIKDASMLKTITSGDLVSVQDKFQDRHDTEISVMQFYSANKLPEIEDKTLAIARRMIPIEFNEVIKVTDRRIKEKLTAEEERKRLLTLLIKIARTTKRHGFIKQPTNEEVLGMLEEKGNPMVQFLNSNYVREKIKTQASKDIVYSLYARFCNKHKFVPRTKKAFGMFMLSRGIMEGRSGTSRYWQGLEINEVIMNKEQEKLKI